MTPTLNDYCPSCGSQDANSSCYNAWHRGAIVHLMHEPIGTPGSLCSAACGTEIDDPPSQLAVDREFVTCSTCYREAIARRVDSILPGLGDLVRSCKLDPKLPTGNKINNDADEFWDGAARIIQSSRDLSDEEIDTATPEDLRAAYRALRDRRWYVLKDPRGDLR